MDLIELQQLVATQEDYSMPYKLLPIEDYEGFILINEKCVFKVDNISNEYDINSDIIIRDKVGNDIGVLLFTKEKEFDISNLNEYQLVAALIDAEDFVSVSNKNYRFKYDYAVIDQDYFLDYECYYKTSSPIWGKYYHSYPGLTISPNSITSPAFFVAENFKGLNQNTYFEACIRGINQSYPFERYMKFYHLIESNFEYDVIKRIKKLDVELESFKMGKLLQEYDKNEFQRILYLFETYVTDINPLILSLNKIVGYQQIAENLLFIYARKENNPFLEDIAKFQAFVAQGNFSLAAYNLVISKKHTNVDHEKFMMKFVAYIIYRIRNSIVHNKIGEYTMRDTDKQFISEFGEPLLFEILKQLFKN